MPRESKALVTRSSSPLATAQDQVTRLGKVLASYAPWRKINSLERKQLGEAKAVLIAVREVNDTAEKGRKMLTKPLLDAKKEIDGIYKEVTAVAESYDSHLVSLLVDFENKERAVLAKAAEKEAKVAEKKGNEQLAEDIREQALSAPVIQGGGLATKLIRRAEVTDLKALCAAIGRGEAPTELVEPRMSALNALVKAGLALPKGVIVVEETVVQRAGY